MKNSAVYLVAEEEIHHTLEITIMSEKWWIPPYDSEIQISTTLRSLFMAASRSFGSLNCLKENQLRELIYSPPGEILDRGELIALELMLHSSIPEDWRILALLKCVMKPELMTGMSYPCYERKGDITNVPSTARSSFLAKASKSGFADDVTQLLDDPDNAKIRVNSVALQKALSFLFCDYSTNFVVEQGLFYLRLEADEKAEKEKAEAIVVDMKKSDKPRMRDPCAVLRDLKTILTKTHAPDSKVIADLIRLQDNLWYLAPELLRSSLPWNRISMLLDEHTESIGPAAKLLFAGLYDSPELNGFQLESKP